MPVKPLTPAMLYFCMMVNRRDIRLMGYDELEQFVTGPLNEKRFRARQVYEWLWKKSAVSFDEMSNLPLALREQLGELFVINAIAVCDKQVSADGTIKSSFRLHDGNLVEGVLIPSDERMTACVSSQVGCSLSCSFCATGKIDRVRNLNSDEIYDQVVRIRDWAQTHYEKPLTNIVFMGMGEPMLNYTHVMGAIHHITSPDGLGMSPERITVSTAGIAKMIRKLATDNAKVGLALSLHAANDAKRNTIMPINESNNLETLIEALNFYHRETGQRVTLEYVALRNFNDSLDDARELLSFCRKVHAKVNIIEYNPTGDGAFERADPGKTTQFANYLESHGITAKIRRSRGKDIDAACGQLANKLHREAIVNS